MLKKEWKSSDNFVYEKDKFLNVGVYPVATCQTAEIAEHITEIHNKQLMRTDLDAGIVKVPNDELLLSQRMKSQS